MTIQKLMTFNAKCLRTKCEVVTDFNDELSQLSTDMIETMIKHDGIGLAAPQVGVTKRVIVVTDVSVETPRYFTVVNPKITFYEGLKEAVEGCLSYPGMKKAIKRPTHIKVIGQSILGEPLTFDVYDLQARIFCHEIDHLNGMCSVAKKKKQGRRELEN